MVFEHSSFRTYLKSELALRIRKNSKYSLRSFARSLGLAPSTLSRVFKGEKSISIGRAHDIASALKLGQAESEYFRLLVQLESVTQPELKQRFLSQLNGLRPGGPITDLSVDLFRTIAEWHPLALLEALELDPHEWPASKLAAFLDVSKPETELALERLERLGLVQKTASGSWKREISRLLVHARKPDGAVTKYYKQVHEKSVQALDAHKPEERAIGTEVFPLNEEDLPKLEKITHQYLNSLLKLARASQKRGSIYQALVHVFRLNRKEPQLNGGKK